MTPKSFSKITQRKQEGTFRVLSNQTFLYDFYSNDYLGISRSLISAENSFSGSTGSRLISGNSIEAENCEHFLADFFEAETGLIFNSGYDANLGLFSSLAERNDTYIYDEFIHASIRDGIRLSSAKSFSFKHNDLNELEKKMKLASGTIFVAVESLYSMDGDFAPLKDILNLCQKYEAFLLVDEAHSGGIFGKQGKGLCNELNIHKYVFARIITFGKAYGTHGAVVLGSEELKSYLTNFARSFIYTTALPPIQYKAIEKAVKLSIEDTKRIKLQENITYFRKLNSHLVQYSDEKSPIQIITLNSISELEKKTIALQENGFGIKMIKEPTVPKGKERIRICLHSFNSFEEIDNFSNLIS